MREFKRILLEAVLIAAVGVGIALVANAKNPAGLEISHNYGQFKGAEPVQGTTQPANVRVVATAAVNATATSPSPTSPAPDATAMSPVVTSPAAANDEREQMKAIVTNYGLTAIDGAEAARLFNDPSYAGGLYLFVDARDDKDYAAGHVPGAIHFSAGLRDGAAKQAILDEIQQAAEGAEKVIVYCNGGHCDDSLAVAVELLHRISADKLAVDIDGFSEWIKMNRPIERGVRWSGDIIGGN